ncbi:hypothetical protein SBV1_1520029 [Verrucomicrobia bacterium]|nr:hypothetical protein SBV1_1520029 [Verrucomicrobiota bacterium]
MEATQRAVSRHAEDGAPAAIGAAVTSGAVKRAVGGLDQPVARIGALGGPAWLNVSAAGSLSGTPGVGDIGTNVFTVTLTDLNGWSRAATLQIVVVPGPLTTSLAFQGTNLVLSWTGGQPPYQVQMATDVANPSWQPVSGPTTNTTLLLAPTSTAAFYRIQSQ